MFREVICKIYASVVAIVDGRMDERTDGCTDGQTTGSYIAPCLRQRDKNEKKTHEQYLKQFIEDYHDEVGEKLPCSTCKQGRLILACSFSKNLICLLHITYLSIQCYPLIIHCDLFVKMHRLI